MDKSQESPKKCFCARCFLPIDVEDKVDIEGQNFHRICSLCCICRTIPISIKMFYGHVFCSDCFKTNVVSRFKGDTPQMHSNSWWMQWAPGARPQEGGGSKERSEAPAQESTKPEEPCKRCICARCLQAVSDNNKVDIGGQSFHAQCAKCYFCHAVPKNTVKIYYGQVFCEECFHRHVMNRNRDNPAEFFKNCFEQWQNNAQFAENMREMMTSNKDSSPFVFMMPGGHPPFCRCGTTPEWAQPSETRKSATPALSAGDESLGPWDLSLGSRTDASDAPVSNESAVGNNSVGAAEKIEKLTKYLHERTTNMAESDKKWKNYELESLHGWADLQDPRVCVDCPKCLWQCGTIYVNSEHLQKEVRCGDY